MRTLPAITPLFALSLLIFSGAVAGESFQNYCKYMVFSTSRYSTATVRFQLSISSLLYARLVTEGTQEHEVPPGYIDNIYADKKRIYDNVVSALKSASTQGMKSMLGFQNTVGPSVNIDFLYGCTPGDVKSTSHAGSITDEGVCDETIKHINAAVKPIVGLDCNPGLIDAPKYDNKKLPNTQPSVDASAYSCYRFYSDASSYHVIYQLHFTGIISKNDKAEVFRAIQQLLSWRHDVLTILKIKPSDENIPVLHSDLDAPDFLQLTFIYPTEYRSSIEILMRLVVPSGCLPANSAFADLEANVPETQESSIVSDYTCKYTRSDKSPDDLVYEIHLPGINSNDGKVQAYDAMKSFFRVWDGVQKVLKIKSMSERSATLYNNIGNEMDDLRVKFTYPYSQRSSIEAAIRVIVPSGCAETPGTNIEKPTKPRLLLKRTQNRHTDAVPAVVWR